MLSEDGVPDGFRKGLWKAGAAKREAGKGSWSFQFATLRNVVKTQVLHARGAGIDALDFGLLRQDARPVSATRVGRRRAIDGVDRPSPSSTCSSTSIVWAREKCTPLAVTTRT